MARLRQQSPNNYRTSGTISDEFENLVRYVNSAEIGNKTIGELLGQLFNTRGEWDGPIEMRLDAIAGLQYRVGAYTDPEAGWLLLSSIAGIRGPSGEDVGIVAGPAFYNRVDYTSTGQTVFDYPFDANYDTLMVWMNGVLQAPSSYIENSVSDTVTFSTPVSLGAAVSILSVRKSNASPYRRSDITAGSGQVVFPFPHAASEDIQTFRNGILLRAGASYDYIDSPNLGTVTLLSAAQSGDVITILVVDDSSATTIRGLMTEANYTDHNGNVPWSRVAVADAGIPAAKVAGVNALSTSGAFIYIQAIAPTSPSYRDLWIDTTISPNALKFYDGVRWIQTAAVTSLPEFTGANANQIVSVNGTGTGLLYRDPDYTTLIQKAAAGVAGGVAQLDSNTKVPAAQLPPIAKGVFWCSKSGAVTNGALTIQRIFLMKVLIIGLTYRTGGGTCNVTLQVNGVNQGTTYVASVASGSSSWTSAIQVDATLSPATIGLLVDTASSATDLEVGFIYVVSP